MHLSNSSAMDIKHFTLSSYKVASDTLYTVNVDIFACIHFRGFMKMGNFAWIKIRVFSTNDSSGYNDSNFYSIYICFRGYLI